MAQDKKAQAPSIAEDAFEALEKDFQDVLQELMGDKSLEKFRLEYEKLHQALRKSHESEKKLVTKCRCVLKIEWVSGGRGRSLFHSMVSEWIDVFQFQFRFGIWLLTMDKAVSETFHRAIPVVPQRAECRDSEPRGKSVGGVEAESG